MTKLSASQKQFLREATDAYHAALPGSPAEEYLATRGFKTGKIPDRFKLGYVADPLTGHSHCQGMLAIPYLRWVGEWVPVSIRFRCIEDHEHVGHGKYMTAAGDRVRLFNTVELLRDTPDIAITEGEIDAITASACGVPAVGVAGANSWKEYFNLLFEGYRNVFILADGDDPGLKFAQGIAAELPNARIVQCPSGEDVNSLVLKHGKQALLERMKWKN